MKYLLAFIALVPFSLYGATVINYDDGSTYTLEENQEIYISTPNSSLFKRQLMGNKDTFFRVQKPWTKRDYVAQPQDPFAVGSHAWCEAYVPWSEGLTFDMITWNNHCDTSNDGVYDICDYYEPTGSATFEELEWQDRCNDGNPWDGQS